MIIARMTECMHDFPIDQCAICLGETAAMRAAGAGSMAGKRFALVYAPSIREDTFVNLNREGEHWKFRRYASPSRPPEEIAQSGASSTRVVIDLASVELVYEIASPYSTSPGGAMVTDSRYWFDAIARVNAQHAERVPALRAQG